VPASVPVPGSGHNGTFGWLAEGVFVMYVSSLSIPVEDHDEFCRTANGGYGVWCHRGELGRFPGLDDDLALAKSESDPSFNHKEPVVTGMDPLVDRCLGRFQAHLDGHGVSRRSTEHPGGAPG
jgi:hypothetical protein